MLQIAYAAILLALAAGVVGYVIGQRYVDARAREMGRAPHDVRATSVNEGGSTAFEDRMNVEILFGTFGGSRNPQTVALGKKARLWSFLSVALACAAITIFAVNEYL